jgi:hypothetical protein
MSGGSMNAIALRSQTPALAVSCPEASFRCSKVAYRSKLQRCKFDVAVEAKGLKNLRF